MSIPEPYRLVLAMIIAGIAFALALHLLNRFAKSPAAVAVFSLEDALSDIKSELKKLADLPGPSLGLILSEVKVTLLVEEDASKIGTAGLAVPVFEKAALKATSKETSKTGSKLTVVLVPPEGSQVLRSHRTTRIDFADLLAATRAALQRSLSSEPVLTAKSIDVELSFVLVTGGTREAAVEAKIVSVGAGSDWQSSNSHTFALKYVNPAFATEEDAAKPEPP